MSLSMVYDLLPRMRSIGKERTFTNTFSPLARRDFKTHTDWGVTDTLVIGDAVTAEASAATVDFVSTVVVVVVLVDRVFEAVEEVLADAASALVAAGDEVEVGINGT